MNCSIGKEMKEKETHVVVINEAYKTFKFIYNIFFPLSFIIKYRFIQAGKIFFYILYFYRINSETCSDDEKNRPIRRKQFFIIIFASFRFTRMDGMKFNHFCFQWRKDK